MRKVMLTQFLKSAITCCALLFHLLLGTSTSNAEPRVKTVKQSPVVQGLVDGSRSENIFGSSSGGSPTTTSSAIPEISTEPTQRVETNDVKEEAPAVESTETSQPESSESNEEEVEDSGSSLSQESILRQAGDDPALLNALEQSRKLKEQLGIVAPRNSSDPNSTIKNLDDTLKKKDKLSEEQKYRF
jgi:hypothetical protein